MKRPVLTVRFRLSRNHERLRKVAQLLGTSMNEIAEVAIERELDFLAADLTDELIETVRLLRGWTYTEEAMKRDLDAFEAGEAGERDPLQAQRVTRPGGAVDIQARVGLEVREAGERDPLQAGGVARPGGAVDIQALFAEIRGGNQGAEVSTRADRLE